MSHDKLFSFVITHRSVTLGNTMPSSNHIEADYRMVLYVIRAIEDGYTNVMLRTCDTDVIIIMIGHFENFVRLCPNLTLYVMFKTSSGTDYYNIKKICHDIGFEYCKGFMLLYAYTGCDYTPSFSYHGKSTWYDLFKKDTSVKSLFQKIANNPTSTSLADLQAMVNFTLRGYGVTNPGLGLLEGRLEVLKRPTTLSFRALPPSPGAAIVQAAKARYVVYIWGLANNPVIDYGDMSKWGWKKVEDRWEPLWTVTAAPSDSVFQDCYRKCAKTCRCKSCFCKVKYKVKCLPECGCKGLCQDL